MNDFYNVEYMSERVAALAKERDHLRRENNDLKEIVEKQVRLNRSAAITALELDNMKAELEKVKAERDKAIADLTEFLSNPEADACQYCKYFDGKKCIHKYKKFCFDETVFWKWRGAGNG